MEPTNPNREETMPTTATPETASPAAYQIESTDDEVIFRISRHGRSPEDISRFVALLELEAIRQKSRLTDEDATKLADEIDQAAWERVRREVFGEE